MNSIQLNRSSRNRIFSGLSGFILIASAWALFDASPVHGQLPFRRSQANKEDSKANRDNHGPKELKVIQRQSKSEQQNRNLTAPTSRRTPELQRFQENQADSNAVRHANFLQSQDYFNQPRSVLPENNSMPDQPNFGQYPPRERSGFPQPNLNRREPFDYHDPMQAARPSYSTVIRQNAAPSEIMEPTNTPDENHGNISSEHPNNNSQYHDSVRNLPTQFGTQQVPSDGTLPYEDVYGNGQEPSFGNQHYGNGQGHFHNGTSLYGNRLGLQQPLATERALAFQNETFRLKEKINRLQMEVANNNRQLESALATIRRQQEELNIAQNKNNELKNQAAVLTSERDAAVKTREKSERQFSEQLKGIETMLDSALISELTDK